MVLGSTKTMGCLLEDQGSNLGPNNHMLIIFVHIFMHIKLKYGNRILKTENKNIS
jgi:hypothetical protein